MKKIFIVILLLVLGACSGSGNEVVGTWSDSKNNFNNGKFLDLASDHTGHVTGRFNIFLAGDVAWKPLDDGKIEITVLTRSYKGRKYVFNYVKKYDQLVKVKEKDDYGREFRYLRFAE